MKKSLPIFLLFVVVATSCDPITKEEAVYAVVVKKYQVRSGKCERHNHPCGYHLQLIYEGTTTGMQVSESVYCSVMIGQKLAAILETTQSGLKKLTLK